MWLWHRRDWLWNGFLVIVVMSGQCSFGFVCDQTFRAEPIVPFKMNVCEVCCLLSLVEEGARALRAVV